MDSNKPEGVFPYTRMIGGAARPLPSTDTALWRCETASKIISNQRHGPLTSKCETRRTLLQKHFPRSARRTTPRFHNVEGAASKPRPSWHHGQLISKSKTVSRFKAYPESASWTTPHFPTTVGDSCFKDDPTSALWTAYVIQQGGLLLFRWHRKPSIEL